MRGGNLSEAKGRVVEGEGETYSELCEMWVGVVGTFCGGEEGVGVDFGGVGEAAFGRGEGLWAGLGGHGTRERMESGGITRYFLHLFHL